MDFIKLKDITSFTVEKVWGFKFKMWDKEQNKMLVSDSWMKGFTKKWDVDTKQGKLDLSDSQFAQMLSSCFDSKSGTSSPVGKTFSVKTNGKTGMDIRYYINLVRDAEQPSQAVEEEIDINDIFGSEQ